MPIPTSRGQMDIRSLSSSTDDRDFANLPAFVRRTYIVCPMHSAKPSSTPFFGTSVAKPIVGGEDEEALASALRKEALKALGLSNENHSSFDG